MADERRGSLPMPALKRPRLDGSPFGPPGTVPLKAMDNGPELRSDLDPSRVVYEVSSSSDLPNDDCGGDSGFHEISLAVGMADTILNTTSDTECQERNEEARTDSCVLEADSSDSQSHTTATEPLDSSEKTSPSSRGQSSKDDGDPQPNFSHCLHLLSQAKDEDDEDRDDVASTISDISGLSDLSDLSGQDWKPIAGPVSWVQQQMSLGRDPRHILQDLVPGGTVIPSQLDEVTLWKIIINILSEPPRRRKLPQINTLEHFLQLLKTSSNILVLTGAGVSVSSGIPDFRSRNGIYARLSKDFPDLPDPQAMFDIHYFRRDPRPFFKFAKEIYPGQFEPSASHQFIRCLEQQGKLLRNYSQNIDTLEQAAGIQKVITCHGSFATASCTQCHYTVDSTVIKEDIFNQCIPHCPKCCLSEGEDEVAVMKPNIVFFGEGLSDEFHRTMAQDKDKCDLLIVMGSSLKVRPVALIPSSIPADVPQILINREPLNHLTFDIELLGDCDVIIEEICNRLGQGWSHICRSANSNSIQKTFPTEEPSLNNNNIHLKNCIPDTTTNGCLWSSKESSSSEEKASPDCDECSSFPHIRLHGCPPSSQDGPDTTSPELANGQEGQSPVNRLWEKGTVQLLEGSHYFVPPSRYIFYGAEVSAAECDSELDSCHSDDNTTDPESDMSVDCRNRRPPVFERSPKDSRKASSESLEDSGFCPTRLFDSK